jgi:DNA-binding IclR family transcriptional regulator
MEREIGDGGDVGGAQSVERATALLLLLGRCRAHGASLSDVVANSGLKQPTARRLLLALIRTGLVQQDLATRRYQLGPSCYVLGTIAAERFGIHRMAVESLVRLAQLSQDTAFITLRSGTYGVCLHREEGTYPIRSHVLAAGDRHPLIVSAGNLAILATLSDPEVEFILRTHEASCAERYPHLTVEAVRAAVAEARTRGFAVNRGLTFPGSWGIGVVIRDADGESIAALSIAAVEGRLGEERQEFLAAALHREAREVESRMAALLTPPVGLGQAHRASRRS